MFGYPSGAIFFFLPASYFDKLWKELCMCAYVWKWIITNTQKCFFFHFLPFPFCFPFPRVWDDCREIGPSIQATICAAVSHAVPLSVCLSICLPPLLCSSLSYLALLIISSCATCLQKQWLTSCGVKGGGAWAGGWGVTCESGALCVWWFF